MAKRKKPDKFPMGVHKATGQYVKKFKGTPYYFGADRDEALKRYVEEWPRIVRGENRYGIVDPARPTEAEPLTVKELVNLFLSAKREQVEGGELTPGMWSEYYHMADQVVETFGLRQVVSDLQPADFGRLRVAAARRLGPAALHKFVTMARTLFGFAYSERLIPAPIWYGDRFNKPERRLLRAARNARPKRLISATDCWKLIDAAGTQLRAMIWLALNCGFGASDCAQLPRSALTTDPGFVVFPRPKTATMRRCPLWNETQAALKAVHAMRPEPATADDADAIFLTRNGLRWVRHIDHEGKKAGTNVDAVLGEFAKVVTKAGVDMPGGFYVLRHVHRTIADGAKDKKAADSIMGHIDGTMADYYVEAVSDERLKAVTDHVRNWLLAGKSDSGQEEMSHSTVLTSTK